MSSPNVELVCVCVRAVLYWKGTRRQLSCYYSIKRAGANISANSINSHFPKEAVNMVKSETLPILVL